jgi:hypothetical protein
VEAPRAVIEPRLGDSHAAFLGARKALSAAGATVPDPVAFDGVEVESGAAGGTGSTAAGRVGMNHGGEFTKLFTVRQPARASFAADGGDLRIREIGFRVTYLT